MTKEQKKIEAFSAIYYLSLIAWREGTTPSERDDVLCTIRDIASEAIYLFKDCSPNLITLASVGKSTKTALEEIKEIYCEDEKAPF